VRLDLGTATNSEAEYQVLSAALKDLSIRIQRAGKSPSGYSLLVHTGSHLMVGQLTQGWKIKAANPLTGSGHACAPWPTRQPPSSRRLATVIPRLRSEEAWSRWPGSIALEVWTLCLGR
jgi:ribonuclease HI